MRFCTQLLLWTYVLLPAISLLLSPPFIIALARAQQQRAKLMANVLAARGRAAAAIARNHQRRYIPNSIYSNGLRQNRAFRLRSKREIDIGVPDVVPSKIENTKVRKTFDRKPHWDQQEESLSQLENMWNMNNFGSNQNDGVIRSMQEDNKSEKAMEEKVGDPFINNHKAHYTDGKSDYYSGAFSGRNVFDDVLEQSEPISIIQNENDEQFIEKRMANPEPTLTKIKKKFGVQQELYPESYYNSYNPHSYYRSSELEDISHNIPTHGMDERTIGSSLINDERLGNPEPTFKKLKKKLGKKQEPYHQNYYNSYQPQYYHGSSYNSYGRSAEFEDMHQDGLMDAKDIPGAITGSSLINDERLGNAEPTFKKLKKKLGKQQEPYHQNYYNSYQPQYYHDSSYNSYGRGAEFEDMLQDGLMDAKDIPGAITGLSINDERLGNPEPTFKKLKKKLGKKQEPYHQNYYNSYQPQYYHGSSYNSYGRSAEFEDTPQDGLMDAKDIAGAIIGEPSNSNLDERLESPEPTFKKLKKKFGQEHEPYSYPPSYYNSYYPQYSHSSSYNYPYRSTEIEDPPQNKPMVDSMGEINGEDFLDMEPKSADPDPTFKKKKKKFSKEPQREYGYSYHQSYPYSNSYYTPYNRESETQRMNQNLQEHAMDDFMMGELVNPRFANPEPTFKKKKETIEHMPPSFYYPQNQHNSYYYPSTYSNSNYNPYVGSTEAKTLDGKSAIKRPDDPKIGGENHFDKQQSVNLEQQNNQKNMKMNQEGGNEFFFSSNFYERENEDAAVNGNNNEANKSKQNVNDKLLQTSLNAEEQVQNNQTPIDKTKDASGDKNINISQTSGIMHTSPNAQNTQDNPEEVGCELEEKIEEKFEKKLKKLLKKDKKKDKQEDKIDYPYPPMYPPSYHSGSEYEQPEYYRSASETDRIIRPIEQETQSQKRVNEHVIEPANNLDPNVMLVHDLSQDVTASNKEPNNLSQQTKIAGNPTTTDQNLQPKNISSHNVANSHSSLDVNQTGYPEEVGCDLSDNLFNPESSISSFDPLSFYQRTVGEISEETNKFTEEAKKLFQPQQKQPVKIVEPKISYVNINENEDPSKGHAYSDLVSQGSDEVSSPLQEKSADPDANPTHHSRGLSHTHSHFHSYTHGHTHQKTIGNNHNLHHLNPEVQIPPIHHHSQVIPHQQGFSQANAKAQSFHHGGVHHNVAHANSNSFGSGFNSNKVFAQSGTQQFSNSEHGGLNRGIVETGPQIFPNAGFGQSAASANSFIQNGGQLNNFGLSHGIAQSGAQALSRGQTNGFASGASALNNLGGGGFGQSSAQATAQAGLTGFNAAQNFGFQSPHDLAIHNNPTQFASSSANTQIVGQPRESFVMPHLDEIPVRDLFSEMKSDTHRFSRTPQHFHDALKGLGFASSIVDASLNKNDFLDERTKSKIDSSLRAGEDNTQFVETIIPRDNLESTQDLPNAFKDLGLASSIVDASLNRNAYLDEYAEERLSGEPKDTQRAMGFVTNIVDSSLKAAESNTQIHDVMKSRANNANQLTLHGISSITDLISKGLRVKRQVASEGSHTVGNKDNIALDDDEGTARTTQDVNNNLAGEPISHLKVTLGEDEVLENKSHDGLTLNNEKKEKNSNQKSNENKNKAHGREIISLNEPSKHSKIKNRVDQVNILEMVDPDTLTPAPEIITNEPWASNWNYKTNQVIYVTPNTRVMLDKNETDKVNDGYLTLASNNLRRKLPADYKESLNVSSGLDNLNKIRESSNFAILDISHASTETYEIVDPEVQSSTEISTISTDDPHELPKNNLSLNNSQKEQDNVNTAKNNSFLGLQSPLNNFNTSKKNKENYENINPEDTNIADEQASTGISREIAKQYLFFPNGTRKNISELTSEEIQDLQFDLPTNSKGDNFSASRDNNSTSGETLLGFSLPNNSNVNNTKESENSTEEFEKRDDLLTVQNTKVEANSTNNFQGNPSQNPKIKPLSIDDRFQKDSARKLISSMSEAPFASIEQEMEVLTEEEKEAFIRQEIDLIFDVIKETVKNFTSQEGHLCQNNATTANETLKGATEKGSIVASPNIFQVRSEYDREQYSRQAQSKTSKEKVFNDLLDQHREKVEKIKNIANKDDDLLMIGFIGDSIIKDLEHRNESSYLNQTMHSSQHNETIDDTEITNPVKFNSVDESNTLNQNASSNEDNRTNKSFPVKTRREIRGIRSTRAPLTQLITDPALKINVEKTLQNLGSIARHTFENPRAPMYHVRNMLGNAKNSVMSAAKVPPNNFLIPSKYEIAKISRNKGLNEEKLGAVNKQMLFSRSGFGNEETGEEVEEIENVRTRPNGNSFGLEDTVQKIGGMVKESVQSGKDAITHVNDIAADAKKVLHASKYVTPRFVRPGQKPMITSRGASSPLLGASLPVTSPFTRYSLYTPQLNRRATASLLGAPLNNAPFNRKTVLIAPRILDVQENIVGEAQEQPDNFLGMGHILDAAGFSEPNQPEVELQRIEFEPLRNVNFKRFTIPKKRMQTTTIKPSVKVDLQNGTQETSPILEAKHSNVVSAQDPVQDDDRPAVNLKDFMQRMHEEMKEIVRLQYEDRKRKMKNKYNKPRQYPYNKKDHTDYEYKKRPRQTIVPLEKPNQSSAPTLGNSQIYYDLRNNDNENVAMTGPPEILNIFSDIPLKTKDKKALDAPKVYSRIQKNPGSINFESSHLGDSLPLKNYAKKYPYPVQHKTQTFTISSNLGDSNDEEKVAFFLPENLMTPFMGQPSETLIHEYMRQNGDEDVFERESSDTSKTITETQKVIGPGSLNIELPKIPTISPLKPINYVVPELYKLNKKFLLPELPITSLDLQEADKQPLLARNPAESALHQEIVGVSLPEKINDKIVSPGSLDIEKKTQEFVELLSDPEIDDSLVSKLVNPNRRGSLDFNTKDIHLEEPNSQPTTLPPLSTIIFNSTEKSTNIPSGSKKNKNVNTVLDPLFLKDDQKEDTKNLNMLDNAKPRPSSVNFNKNLLTVGNVPDENDLGYVLGAINPMMFERHFNERLKINDTSSKDTHDKFLKHGIIKAGDDDRVELGHLTDDESENKPGMTIESKQDELIKVKKSIENPIQNDVSKAKENLKLINKKDIQEKENDDPNKMSDQGRTSMKVPGPYKKPFMGYIGEDKIHEFLNQYNNNLYEEGQHDKYDAHENYDKENKYPVKDVVFSSVDDDQDYNFYGY